MSRDWDYLIAFRTSLYQIQRFFLQACHVSISAAIVHGQRLDPMELFTIYSYDQEKFHCLVRDLNACRILFWQMMLFLDLENLYPLLF
jgi:hypothetical protein